ncbi:MAG TPA: hypothetical protein VHF92_08795 [Geodermatophilus sp.]|nr:hypothetical protein [Geodermatophilus sp.]
MHGEPQEQEWEAVPPGWYGTPPPPPGPSGPVPPYGSGYAAPPPYGYGTLPGYGYGTPSGCGYGAPPAWARSPVPASWPYGPGRPGAATAAAVLGFVTGGLTALVCLGFLFAVAAGDDDAPSVLLVLGLPCAAGLIAGGVRLLSRRRGDLLFGSAVAAVAVLVLAFVAGAVTLPAEGVLGLGVFLLFALPLPVLTAVFARLPRVTGWQAAGAPGR